MTVYLDMLCTFVKDGVSSDINNSLTVRMKRNRVKNRNMKVLKKMMKPFQLTKSNDHGRYLALEEEGDIVCFFFVFQEIGEEPRKTK